MKPFLGIDLTTDKKNFTVNGLEFLVMEPSEALAKSLEDSQVNAEETIEKADIPLVFRILELVTLLASVIFIRAITKADVSFSEGYQNAPWLYWAGGISIVVCCGLWFWSKRREKKVLGTDESAQTFSKLEGIASAIHTELGVPAYAKDVDVMSFFYKNDKDEIKVKEKGMQFAKYRNLEFKIFSDSENLYLANCEGKFSFPLSDIVSIKKVKKNITLNSWNKEEKYNKGIYKQYKMTVDNYGTIHCKGYVLIEIKRDGETFAIYSPNYELPTFEEITRIKACE